MPGPESLSRAAETNETPLEGLLQQYAQKYEETKFRVEKLTNTQVRDQLQQFLQNNQLQIDGQPDMLTDEQQVREVLTYSLMIMESEPIKQQILQQLDDQLKNNPDERYQILRDQMMQVAQSEVVDITLIQDLIERIFTYQVDDAKEYFSRPDQQKQINDGYTWITQGKRPDDMAEGPAPQQVVFTSFRTSILFTEQYPELRQQLATDIRSADRFVEATFDTYQKFLADNGFDVQKYCPNPEFYKRICGLSGIETELMQSLDVTSMMQSNNVQEALAVQKKVEEEAAQQYQLHLQEKDRLQVEVDRLYENAEGLREAGNEQRAQQVEARAKQIEEQVKTELHHMEYYENVQEGASEALEHVEEAVRRSDSALALFPGHPNAKYLGTVGQGVFTGISSAFDWVGRHTPSPGSLYDMDAGKMMWGGAKVALSAGVAINAILLGTMSFKRAKASFGDFFKGRWKSSAKNAVGIVGDWFTDGFGTTATLAGSAAAIALIEHGPSVDSFLNKAESQVKRFESLDYVSDVSDWVKNSMAPWLKNGVIGIKNGLVGVMKGGYEVLNIEDVLGWTDEQWEDLKRFTKETGIHLDRFQEYFASMKTLKNHTQNQLSTVDHLKSLDISTDTIGISTDDYGMMLNTYASQLKSAPDKNNPPQLYLIDLAGTGMLYKNGTQLSRDTLRNDPDFQKLSPDQKGIQISKELAEELSEQANFWRESVNN